MWKWQPGSVVRASGFLEVLAALCGLSTAGRRAFVAWRWGDRCGLGSLLAPSPRPSAARPVLDGGPCCGGGSTGRRLRKTGGTSQVWHWSCTDVARACGLRRVQADAGNSSDTETRAGRGAWQSAFLA